MPTQGSANPALTIMVLASRLAELLGRKQVGTTRRAAYAGAGG
jgi:choline dehydrogenase-like flavoprotein